MTSSISLIEAIRSLAQAATDLVSIIERNYHSILRIRDVAQKSRLNRRLIEFLDLWYRYRDTKSHMFCLIKCTCDRSYAEKFFFRYYDIDFDIEILKGYIDKARDSFRDDFDRLDSVFKEIRAEIAILDSDIVIGIEKGLKTREDFLETLSGVSVFDLSDDDFQGLVNANEAARVSLGALENSISRLISEQNPTNIKRQ